MTVSRLTHCAFIAASLLVTAFPIASRAQDNGAIKEVKAILAKVEKTHERLQDYYWDKQINIHGSGWIYTKADDFGPGKGYEEESAKYKSSIIKSERTQYQILSPNDDTVIESWLGTTYYEVPEPEAVARAAGVIHYDAKAVAAANQRALETALPPGMTPSANPYRNRETRVWSKIGGKWLITAEVGSRVGERVLIGRVVRY